MDKHPLARRLGILMVTLAMVAGAAPALAVSDVDLLKQYVGDWRGRGQLTGANTETVVCRMSLAEGNQDKVVYHGRCALAGTQFAIDGTVAYIASTRRFEAAMTTNSSFAGKAIGQKRGETIVFDLKDTQKDEAGNDLDVSARMTFAGGRISADFTVVYPATGDTIRASVPFTR